MTALPVYILKRLATALPVLIGVSILAFSLVRLVPGDTVTVLLGARYSEEEAQALREREGLDAPLPLQYVRWLGRACTGDLGQSMITGQEVTTALSERIPVTLQLAAGSLLFALLAGIPLGILAAAHRNGPLDAMAGVIGLLGISIPGFWLGTLLILWLSLSLGWLPSGGFTAFTESPIDNLQHMIMPTVALGMAVAAVVLRMTRSSMLEVLGEDYVETARAKGAGELRVLWIHALKNALIPVITVFGIQAGYLLGGSVVIEAVFSLPGVGLLALEAIQNRDYVLLQGILLFIATAFVTINILVDILYVWINPRMRAS